MANSKSYEETRKQRVEENNKRLQDMGILKLSKSLSEDIKPMKKSPKPKLKTEILEVRRSSRERNHVTTYAEEMKVEFSRTRKRFRSSSTSSYLAVPYEDVKVASYEERTSAQRYAEDFQANLQHPSFVKSMVRSHVYSCFWLGLPHNFCKNHLPAADLTMVLENEKGSEYESLYIGRKRGLSGGWRRFALDHKLDDGDALVFELTESDRFKVYIFRPRMESLTKKKAAKSSNQKASKPKKKIKLADEKDDSTLQSAQSSGGVKRTTRNSSKQNATLDEDVEKNDGSVSPLFPWKMGTKLLRKKRN